MRLTDNTILITGGTSGIGLELAVYLSKLRNKVIVTGRDPIRLQELRRTSPEITAIQSDVSDPKAIDSLYQNVTGNFPSLNVLINNAGIMRKINLNSGPNLDDIVREIDINLSGPVRMVVRFLKHLQSQKRAAIINVSSGLAFVPFPISPVYCATKAAIHSFTQSLRVQLKNTNVAVFELAPPGVETPLLTNEFSPEDVGSTMDVKVLVKKAIAGLEKDRLEIRPGLSNALKLMSRFAPEFGLKQLSKPVDLMLAQANR